MSDEDELRAEWLRILDENSQEPIDMAARREAIEQAIKDLRDGEADLKKQRELEAENARLRALLTKAADALHGCLVDLGQIAEAQDAVTYSPLGADHMQRIARNASRSADPVFDEVAEWAARQEPAAGRP